MRPVVPPPHPWIAAWERDLRARGQLSFAEITELVDHLDEAFSRATGAGLPAEQAFLLATESLGDPAQLVFEFERNRFMRRSLFLRLAALATTTLPIIAAGWSVGFAPLLHLPSCLLVGGVVITGLLASFGPRAVSSALHSTSGEAEPVDAELARSVFRRGYQLSWAAAVLGLLLGVISTLSNLSDPAQLGPAAALSVLSMLYGAMLAELGFRNLEHWVPIALRT